MIKTCFTKEEVDLLKLEKQCKEKAIKLGREMVELETVLCSFDRYERNKNRIDELKKEIKELRGRSVYESIPLSKNQERDVMLSKNHEYLVTHSAIRDIFLTKKTRDVENNHKAYDIIPKDAKDYDFCSEILTIAIKTRENIIERLEQDNEKTLAGIESVAHDI